MCFISLGAEGHAALLCLASCAAPRSRRPVTHAAGMHASASKAGMRHNPPRPRRASTPLPQQSGRNDTRFFASVMLLIALPPAVLLFWAFSSGYIESIDRYGLLR